MPITYTQMKNSGRSVFYVRGGGKYWFYSTRNATWELKTGTFTVNEQTVAPTKTYFTPESKNLIKTLGVNISGTATKATNDGNGANIATTYLKKAGDTVTGTLNVPTQATTDNSTKVANTAFVQSAVGNIVNVMYPVGIIVEFVEGVDPNAKWVGTTWQQYEATNKWKRTA